MPLICYQNTRFRGTTLSVIDQAIEIIDEYQAQGFDLTLRQLYYQFVARDLIPNTQRSYDRLGSIINNARLAGLIDWDALVDRTRFVRSLSHWTSPAAIIHACANQFRVDKWKTQDYRPEVWIEKDALVGVIEDICNDNDVPYFSCRGYVSQSEMWGASQRLLEHMNNSQTPHIIHLGDHDPSGIDMSRDITDRLMLFLSYHGFTRHDFHVQRIALNMDQVERYDPPPNPAKMTDSRYEGYIEEYGTESWELDALNPATLSSLIENTILGLRDDDLWEEAKQEEEDGRAQLREVADTL